VEVQHMTTREAKHAVLLREWSMMVQQCQDSGLTVNEWCNQNSIGVSSYYYRLGQVRKSLLERSNLMSAVHKNQPEPPTLVKVDASFPSAAQSSSDEQSRRHFFHLKYNGAVLEIPIGTNAEDIAEVLKAMGQYAF